MSAPTQVEKVTNTMGDSSPTIKQVVTHMKPDG